MVGHGGSSAGSYLADPTSPIPSHCASIVATSTVRIKFDLLSLVLWVDIRFHFDTGFTVCFEWPWWLIFKVLEAVGPWVYWPHLGSHLCPLYIHSVCLCVHTSPKLLSLHWLCCYSAGECSGEQALIYDLSIWVCLQIQIYLSGSVSSNTDTDMPPYRQIYMQFVLW